jgi:hypothetical protein
MGQAQFPQHVAGEGQEARLVLDPRRQVGILGADRHPVDTTKGGIEVLLVDRPPDLLDAGGVWVGRLLRPRAERQECCRGQQQERALQPIFNHVNFLSRQRVGCRHVVARTAVARLAAGRVEVGGDDRKYYPWFL